MSFAHVGKLVGQFYGAVCLDPSPCSCQPNSRSNPSRAPADRVSNQVFQIRDLRKALCVGGIFAVSTVLPEKIQHLAFHVGTISRAATDEVVEHSLQVLGCFLVLSVLIWAISPLRNAVTSG